MGIQSSRLGLPSGVEMRVNVQRPAKKCPVRLNGMDIYTYLYDIIKNIRIDIIYIYYICKILYILLIHQDSRQDFFDIWSDSCIVIPPPFSSQHTTAYRKEQKNATKNDFIPPCEVPAAAGEPLQLRVSKDGQTGFSHCCCCWLTTRMKLLTETTNEKTTWYKSCRCHMIIILSVKHSETQLDATNR